MEEIDAIETAAEKAYIVHAERTGCADTKPWRFLGETERATWEAVALQIWCCAKAHRGER